MKRWIVILVGLMVLLCGCAAAQQSEPTEQTVPTTVTVPPTTVPPETEPPETEPVDPVEQLLSAMTTEQKIGQIFLAVSPGEASEWWQRDYNLGGLVLMSYDFENETPESIRGIIRDHQSASSIPMLIAVDEEGGSVCRISTNPAFRTEPFASPRDLYRRGGMSEVLDTETEKAAMLWDLGINVELGPVCDISRRTRAFMYSRSLGEKPDVTAQFVEGMLDRLADFSVGGVLKHFPGYGDNLDTHRGIAQDWRSLAQLEGYDLLPFAAGIGHGCGAVLVSHTVVHAMDSDLPASLSPAVHEYLRQNMGFDGVIMTDDLNMAAITMKYGAGEAAVLAVLAGNSMICSGSYPEQYDAILEAVNSGRISMEQLDSAVTYVLRWKQQLGLLG